MTAAVIAMAPDKTDKVGGERLGGQPPAVKAPVTKRDLTHNLCKF